MPNLPPENPLGALLSLSVAEQEARGLRHTAAEIAQQPAAWRGTFSRLQSRLPDLRDFLAQPPTVFLIGAGTSDYIGHCLTQLFRRRLNCETLAVPSTTLLTEFDEYLRPGKRYLWLHFSRSGDSPESVAVLERALAETPQVAHLVITCNRAGRMAQLAGAHERARAVVLDDATNDRGLAMTSSFTNMVVAGQILAAGAEKYATKVLPALCAAGGQFLATAADAAHELAACDFRRVCFLGAGALQGAARESALKVLELTAGRVLTLSETPLGLRHGPLAALDKETLLVAYCSGEATRRRYEITLLEEIKRKKLAGATVAIAPAETELRPCVDYLLTHGAASLSNAYRPPLDVIFGQLYGLFASLRLGLRPDAPSPGGAISRVVSSI
jgi:tagatose-6-phosphate ketose/aldose isomerase